MRYNNNLIARLVKENEKLDNTELLNWLMNQLFRAARTMDLLQMSFNVFPPSAGCDAAAILILKRLTKTKRGYRLVEETNAGLLKGFKKP